MDDALSDRDVFWRLRLSQPQITWVWADRGYVDELMDWDRERLQSFDLGRSPGCCSRSGPLNPSDARDTLSPFSAAAPG
ncbi:hypothetical protein [Streptomyces olivochromogenes]|uniref:hypothetical protein n=1 Tax=Streptomyces olivochromogenes TaxID=1963 RepID=UPI0036860294